VFLQLCSGGSVTDLAKKLLDKKKKLDEDIIAFIVKVLLVDLACLPCLKYFTFLKLKCVLENRFVLQSTLEALIFLHSKNIIHRDVKGQNILLTDQAEVKLVDFGKERKDRQANHKIS
jgi:serine/threonine protein kinase